MNRGEHLGIRYEIGPRTPCPGIGWRIRSYDHLGQPAGWIESQGAFYDDCEDHPDGAYAWAENAVRRWIEANQTKSAAAAA